MQYTFGCTHLEITTITQSKAKVVDKHALVSALLSNKVAAVVVVLKMA